jgi:sarcosine oxidase subunit beta
VTTSPHIIIIGAGSLGLCTAMSLAEQGAKVTVLEAKSIASGSTGRSVGVVGTQFTDPEEILLRRHAMAHFAQWEEAGLRFNHIGYLRLARSATQMALFETSVRLQAKAGFRARVFHAEELTSLVPHIDVAGLAGGIFGPDNGFLDPHELCMFLAGKLKAAGGSLHQYCTVTDITRQNGGYRLATSKGPFDSDIIVNAAGAWAPRVARMLGQSLHVRAERHEAVLVLLDRPLDYTMPMVMDLVNGEGTGLNFRHEKRGELIAEIHKGDAVHAEDPDAYNEHCDEASKIHLAELLLERLPDLSGARLGRGWAGLYPVTADHRPFVGPINADEPTIVTAAGAGGYGIQLAPVIGQMAADWALHGAPVSTPGLESLAPTAARNVAP